MEAFLYGISLDLFWLLWRVAIGQPNQGERLNRACTERWHYQL